VSQLQDQRKTFVVDIESEDLIEFVLMERMGFFEKTEDRFRMVIPKNLGIDAVKAAVLELASTDGDEWIHPERLVVSMTYHNAKKTQAYLRDLDDMRRLSHRFES
jgi:hypothetical protein